MPLIPPGKSGSLPWAPVALHSLTLSHEFITYIYIFTFVYKSALDYKDGILKKKVLCQGVMIILPD